MSSLNDLDPGDYQQYIGEKVERWTYLKSPYYMPTGYPDGIYRVGPLARLNVADRCGTPRADQELAEFHELQRTAVLSSFHYHHARLIEILYCVERLEQLLNILKSSQARSRHCTPERLRRRGLLRSSARYALPSLQDRRAGPDPLGRSHHRHRPQRVAMNRSILQVAQHFVHGERFDDRHAESGRGRDPRLRPLPELFDPCLGEMPLVVQLVNPSGEVLHEVRRPC